MQPSLTNGLLTLELTDEALDAVFWDVRSEVETDARWPFVVASGVEARVMGMLVERRLAGEVTPNVWAGIVLTGCEGVVANTIRALDGMLLDKEDCDALELRVMTVQSDISRRRVERKRGFRVSRAKTAS